MPFSSHLKVLGLAATLLAGPIAAAPAEIATSRPATTLPVDTSVKPWPAPTGHRQPHAADVSPGANLSADLLELEVDRKLRICRGC
ncbi:MULTISPECIES: hypothetical protein [unclassified Bradyrhizobium]|jgi:hypothetical protein|uniref:hypothetical protein n=1 Tax=unclassified Bradyrhizobium TaxID=2631580 RepID=UPI001FEF7F08|nr:MULTISPECIES: hypothetical protein [unclassified Bradyrhizobium]